MVESIIFSSTDKGDDGFGREVVVKVKDRSDARPREEFNIA